MESFADVTPRFIMARFVCDASPAKAFIMRGSFRRAGARSRAFSPVVSCAVAFLSEDGSQ